MINNDSDSVSFNKLYELAMYHIVSKAISVAAKLKLDTLISEQPVEIEMLARDLNFNERALWRFLRVLDAYDVVELLDNKKVKASKLTPYLSHICSPHIFDSYDCMDGIEYSLQNNAACYAQVFGEEFYPHILAQPDQIKMFTEWCTESMRDWMSSVFKLYDFTQFKHLVDVGGGQGQFLATILKENIDSTGILFDQAAVVEQARSVLEDFAVADRVKIVAGDFFHSVPKGGDVYIICRTLLNWSDEEAIKILNVCHSAMDPSAKLVIVDFYMPEKTHPHYQRGILSDFNLFALVNSANRTVNEWEELLEKSRFTLCDVHVSGEAATPEPILPICVIEAAP